MKKLLAAVVVICLIYGVNALSTVAAQYFNNHTAIQFLNWLHRV